MKPIPRLYVHFADYYHVRRAKLNMTPHADIANTLSKAARIAVLFAHEVYFPASSLFESPDCRRVVSELPEFREQNIIKMAAGDANVTAHLESKAAAYGVGSPTELSRAYGRRQRFSLPTYVEKRSSSTADITRAWNEILHDEEFTSRIRDRTGVPLPKDFRDRWESVPADLVGRAFVPDHAVDVLRTIGTIDQLRDIVDLPIERGYIDGYGMALDAHVMIEVPYLSSAKLETALRNPAKLSYRDVMQRLTALRLVDQFLTLPSRVLFEIACRTEWERLAQDIVRPGADPDVALIASSLCEELSSRSAEDVRKISRQMELAMPMGNETADLTKLDRKQFDVVIITALPVEFAAVRLLIGDGQALRVVNDPGTYWSGTFQGEDGTEKRVLVALLTRMGNLPAATATSNVLRSFEVEHLLFCGIALGVPRPMDVGKHVRLGDVVLGDREGVIHLGHRALLPNGKEQNRSNLPPPPPLLTRALNEMDANAILGEHPWIGLIEQAIARAPKRGTGESLFARPASETDVVLDGEGVAIPHPTDHDRHPDRPKIHRGQIGSSDTLVKDAEFRDLMAGEHNLLAMEMEAAGTLEAAWHFGRSAMVVRGVCDYGLGKTDIWHAYAALAAAAVSLCLVTRL